MEGPLDHLRRMDLKREKPRAAQHGERRGAADALGGQGAVQVVDAVHRGRVEGEDEVARLHAGRGARAAGNQRLGGRWKILVIYHLFDGIARFNELQRAVQGISKRVLTQQLRQLERDGIVSRRVYDQSPPRVEYSLTDFGRTLAPVMERLCEWGELYAQRSSLRTSG